MNVFYIYYFIILYNFKKDILSPFSKPLYPGSRDYTW